MTFKILICDRIADEGIKLMEEKGYEISRCWDLPKTQLTTMIADYDAIIVRSATKVTAEMLANAKTQGGWSCR